MDSADTLETSRYTLPAIVLHWLLALALLGLFGMGLFMADLPISPLRLKLYNWHKWAGVTVLTLSLLRWAWRLTHRPPALPEALVQSMPVWQRVAHHATHHALYALFFIVPLVGWAYSSAAGFPIVVFGLLPLPDWMNAGTRGPGPFLRLVSPCPTERTVLAVKLLTLQVWVTGRQNWAISRGGLDH